MGVLDRIFRPTLTRARQAASAGRMEEALRLFVEAGAPDEAEQTVFLAADRQATLADRITVLRVAARLLLREPGTHARLALELGQALASLGQDEARPLAERRMAMIESAGFLEHAGRAREAADAYLAAGDRESAARVLERAGEVERLEALLGSTSRDEARDRERRAAMAEYECAMESGARSEALAALGRAIACGGPDDALERARADLERRLVRRSCIRLLVDGRPAAYVGTSRLVIGREGDVSFRGAGLSRRHAELVRSEDGVQVRDLGSRNGTRVAGVPIAASIALKGPGRVELGDDVALAVEPTEAGLALEVIEGPDRGLRVMAHAGAQPVIGTDATIGFVDGRAVLHPGPTGARLGGRTILAPIDLLVGDVIELAPHRVEVLG